MNEGGKKRRNGGNIRKGLLRVREETLNETDMGKKSREKHSPKTKFAKLAGMIFSHSCFKPVSSKYKKVP